ncbi:hypothetical protein [Streptomyces pseudogriseolus]|uniref:DNA polymerase III subunit beta family protein n=1 Tax=Streptomyces pseudogriseolus TaxID=36817 RepID=UPI00366A07E1
MSVNINAHQLGRLITQTMNHMGADHIEALHGIRLDADARYLYAVASDRYTLAVARYRLNDGDQNQEPWAGTIPARHVATLREWIEGMEGAALITVSTAKGRMFFEGAETDLTLSVNAVGDFPDWRGLLNKMIQMSAEGEPFPALNSGLLGRFDNTAMVRARLIGNEKPLLVFGEDFIGAQMPARYSGIYPTQDETFETARQSWQWTLSAGSADATLDQPAAEENKPRYEASRDIRETGADLLREVLRSTTDVTHADYDADNELWMAHIRIGVANWQAFRYLAALHNADPRAAQAAINETANELDSGEIGEWAWDEAKAAGFDPQQWHDEYEAHLIERGQSKRADFQARLRLRLASALNEAKKAGINITVEPNDYVAYDEQLESWATLTDPSATTTA